MGKVKDEQFFTLIKNFFLVYLPVQRKASEKTIRTYRTTMNQFLKYLADTNKVPLNGITMQMFSYDSVNSYLDSLTNDFEVKATTRNNKLAALKAFTSYAAACNPEYLSLSASLEPIKSQRIDRFAKVDWMTEEAVEALFNAPDTSTPIGIRDQFLMIFIYDTGARIQEVVNVRLCDLKVDSTPTVQLYGKGRKIRVVPLMMDTVKHLQRFLKVFHAGESLKSEESLFYVEHRGVRNTICDDTIRLRMQHYADLARKECHQVPDRVYPHLWRHTRAMHLYQHGMDLMLISQWLGHANIETTLIYAHADTEDKRRAIEKAISSGTETPEDIKFKVDDEELLKRLYGL